MNALLEYFDISRTLNLYELVNMEQKISYGYLASRDFGGNNF